MEAWNTRREVLAGGMCAAVVLSSLKAAAEERPGWDAAERRVATFQTTAVLVLVGGEPAWSRGDVTAVSYLASARKSVMSMLYGPAVARGEIDLDATLAQIGIDDIEGLSPLERTATIRDLLRARSGIYHPAANAGDASDLAPARGSVRPGERFLYNNWDFNALGTIFERTTGRGVYQAFTQDLAGPLGLRDWLPDLQQVRNDTGRSSHPAHHFGLSTRDMAALGRLMVQDGIWEGRAVLPPGWVALTTAASTRAEEVARTSPFIPGLGYGYLWWVFDDPRWGDALEGAYTASGAYGQFITVIPKFDAVIAHKTAVPPPRNVPAEAYFTAILPAIVAALQADRAK